ncbi:hypothetical protein H17ap60334_10375 [Thermosipho africanus H17ap60334]|jgi:hypothetical protein|uniref:Uncharacterized protein n=1 Tax=Thermosipho africanus (strain TCF52B) TaxID=484019 RepID=B7IFT3_THEAB|nr:MULTISPECIES: hypothetical protein [Thermosipho]EKF48681.1 hypothetical protein H17ap60334_10375 [Thermosipho africanus H17ap60334]HCF37766.1 hypothetical protein [Thermosipho africanus]ACJ74947.1 conserved hypothetical protein [Thermosipho africanus TCF52B]MBZ4650237.1 hypothetical protein [Thermosipho sp. (in: thermotogales)]MDK2900587.1 hypothetical protein [Thermosipho sp. (in: thermotogales)]
MKNEKYKLIVFLEFLIVYVFSSFILRVNYFTLSPFVVKFFIFYFLVLSLFSSIKGKQFLFSEISRLWIYSFTPLLCYLFFTIGIYFHILIDSRFSYFIPFLFSNYYNLEYDSRKYITLLRLFSFSLFILGVK